MKNFNAESKLTIALKAYLTHLLIQDQQEKNLSQMFQSIDKDKNGTISKDELKEAYEIFG